MKIWLWFVLIGIITFLISSFVSTNNPGYFLLPIYGVIPLILGLAIGFFRLIRRAKYE